MLKEYFASSLSFFIALRNITKQTLASAIGLNRASVTQMSKGSSLPSVEKLIEIADYFDVSLDTLVSRKIFKEPEGILPYIFKSETTFYQGNLKYVFGLVRDENTLSARKFLYLEDDANFIDAIIKSSSQFEFITLAYFLNTKLHIGYNAFENNGVDLIVKFGNEYQEIAIEYGAYSCRFGYVSYADYLSKWIPLPVNEKFQYLSKNN